MSQAHAPHKSAGHVLHTAVALPQDGDEHTERGGVQSSAAWCLSAVLLFMSLLLLRQAFEPLSRQSEAPRTAMNAGGQNRHIAKVLGAPASPLRLDNMTSTVLMLPSGSAMGPDLKDEQVIRKPSCPMRLLRLRGTEPLLQLGWMCADESCRCMQAFWACSVTHGCGCTNDSATLCAIPNNKSYLSELCLRNGRISSDWLQRSSCFLVPPEGCCSSSSPEQALLRAHVN